MDYVPKCFLYEFKSKKSFENYYDLYSNYIDKAYNDGAIELNFYKNSNKNLVALKPAEKDLEHIIYNLPEDANIYMEMMY